MTLASGTGKKQKLVNCIEFNADCVCRTWGQMPVFLLPVEQHESQCIGTVWAYCHVDSTSS